MERREFVAESFKCGVGICLGMLFFSKSNVLASLKSLSENNIDGETDPFLNLFNGIRGDLNRDLSFYFNPSTIEYQILSEFKAGWGNVNTVELISSLSAKYDNKAISTISQFIKKSTPPYWIERGKSEARDGSEVEDFIKILWGGMGNDFKFTSTSEAGVTKFCVSKCPYAELANKTNLHEWIYQMACITDYYMTPAFSNQIGFSRTKTMVQSNDSCNHLYYHKQAVKSNDSLLAYCGLYCGGCPNNQNTKKVTAVNFRRENRYDVCEGCNSGFVTGYCAQCKIKACARSRNIRICLDCSEYPCDKMNSFINDKQFPYHQEVEEKMKQFKKLGLDEWLHEQDKIYHCRNCGTEFNFFQTKCDNCGNQV